MGNCHIRIHDLSQLWNKPVEEVTRTVARMGLPLELHFRRKTVDWDLLASRLDGRTRRKIETAAKNRHFDWKRGNWTVASFPTVLALWDAKRNRSVKPSEVGASSTKPVWWKCPVAHDHVWEVSPNKLLIRQTDCSFMVLGCPFCSHHRTAPRDSLAAKSPKIAREWHPTRNADLKPTEVAPNSKKVVWWQCAKGHTWEAAVRERAPHESPCPYCRGARLAPDNSLAKMNPKLAAEWHPTKNRTLKPADVTGRDSRQVWWRCAKAPDHEWKASVAKRSDAPSCPFCANRVVSKDNSLALLHPELAKQWHRARNAKLTPRDVVEGSGRKVWWKCPKGPDHEWCARVVNRAVLGSGCPFCAGLKASKTNCLARLAPAVAREWHPTKNRDLTPAKVNVRSTKQAFWKCPKGHVWREKIFKRTVYQGACPTCTAPPRKRRAARESRAA